MKELETAGEAGGKGGRAAGKYAVVRGRGDRPRTGSGDLRVADTAKLTSLAMGMRTCCQAARYSLSPICTPLSVSQPRLTFLPMPAPTPTMPGSPLEHGKGKMFILSTTVPPSLHTCVRNSQPRKRGVWLSPCLFSWVASPPLPLQPVSSS
jgi:hypothetical protein